MTIPAPTHDAAALTEHSRHREHLPELAALAERMESVPGRPKPRQKDEVNLFPAIRQGDGPGLDQPIAAMRADHEDHAAEVARIRALTGGLTLPEGACRKWTALYESLDRFFADLEEHMRLENDALFLQVERRAWRPEQREVPERR